MRFYSLSGRRGPVRRTLGATLAALVLAMPTAGVAEPEQAPELPPAVQALTDRGLNVVERFQAPGGLTGFTARAGGREVVLYATADGQHVLVGTLLDAEGRNLSQDHLAKHLPEPDRNQDWARLAEAEWIATGAEDPERVVYMFTDPYCPYCNAIWRASEPYYDDGLQIRHILVGVIRPQSADKAAAILQADDPAAAFRTHQKGYDRSDNAQVPGQVSDQARAAVQANNQLMRELGIGGTPAVYYKTADGKVKLANGMPKLSKLAKMYRLPEQSVDDPSLDRFR